MFLEILVCTFVCTSDTMVPSPTSSPGCKKLYDTSLCSAETEDCNKDQDVRINYSGETATLNCPDNYRLKIRYGDGKIQGDVTVKQFKANFQIYCLDGRWGVFNKDDSAKKDVSSGEEITGLACHKEPPCGPCPGSSSSSSYPHPNAQVFCAPCPPFWSSFSILYPQLIFQTSDHHHHHPDHHHPDHHHSSCLPCPMFGNSFAFSPSPQQFLMTYTMCAPFNARGILFLNFTFVEAEAKW
ncbi:unnamed protein product [Cylicocyclus nassatus]|uniref:Uncharacterized protein n=1 Tax=Cylicocyclus nassatus TaxID=53992 RepID=A0AA36DP14_CYLNA|nr:unnamed protein product [Cylicocyclus nassatus]